MGLSGISGYGNPSNLAGLPVAQTNQPTLLDYLDQASQSTASDNLFDVLDLSDAGQKVADTLGGSSSPLGGSLLATLFDSTNAEGIQASADNAFATVQAELRTLFREQEIDTSRELKLQVGHDGSVIVANNHPQKAEIEQLFKNDPTLRDAFVKFTALSELAAAAREAVAFQAAYAKDPTAAVAEYSYLFDNADEKTLSLSILDDTYQSLFERPGREPVVVSTTDKS